MMRYTKTTVAVLALLAAAVHGTYTPDWDADATSVRGSTAMRANNYNDIKQSYIGGGVPTVALTPAPVPAKATSGANTGVYSGGNTNNSTDDNDDDSDDDVADAPLTPVSGPTSAPLTHAPSPAATPVLIVSTTPAPVLANTATNDDSDDGDDDGDDAPAPAPVLYGGKPYEQNDNNSGGKQSSGNKPPAQIDTSGGADGQPKVNNGGVNLHSYSQELRDYIVQTHNWARGSLVPTEAANMRQLRWDESLAIEASELVNTCVFEHDTENYAYGQNLMYGGNALDKAMIDSWMDNWVKNELSSYDRSGTGYMDLDHASTVLWANSYLVGCASKLCPKGYLTACNYYTPGNWQGEQAYIPGPSCSQCPSKAPYCDATGKLCTADPTGAAPTSRPDQSPVQTAAPVAPPASASVAPPPSAPASVPGPAPTPAKTTPSVVPAPTPAKSTSIGPKIAPAPASTPKLTIPHELCV